MKAAYPLLVGIGVTVSAFAQEPAGPDEKSGLSDSVQKAIEEFNRRKKEADAKANEVIVVLDPPAPPSEKTVEQAPEPDTQEMPEEEEIPAAKIVAEPEVDSEPVLVTGKPTVVSEDPEEIDQPIAANPDIAEESAEPEATDVLLPDTTAEPALEARVESIRKGTGPIDPGQVKLKASFPSKPLSSDPAGWKLERSEQAPVFRKDVELQPGTTISLSIRPHILTPDSDGFGTFSVGEPGFQAAQGYLQENTVSSILGTSVAQLDRDSLQLGNAISELHRLLASLPKPEETEKP